MLRSPPLQLAPPRGLTRRSLTKTLDAMRIRSEINISDKHLESLRRADTSYKEPYVEPVTLQGRAPASGARYSRVLYEMDGTLYDAHSTGQTASVYELEEYEEVKHDYGKRGAKRNGRGMMV